MAEDTTQAGTGAPSADPQPQQGNSTTPTTPAPGETGNDVKNPEAKKYADEAAAERRARKSLEAKLAQYEEAQKQAELAKLGDLERAQKQAADIAKERDTFKARVSDYAVRLEASKLGIVDPELAALAIAGKLEFADDGTPSNATDLLKELVKAKPYLAGQQSQQAPQRPPANSGGATNPGAGSRANGAITRATYAAMSQQERIARNKEVMETMRQNGGRLPD